MSDSSQYFMSSSNDKIAYRCNGLESDTTIFFFGGYASSMTGTKATSLQNWTLKKNLNFVRFDYSGNVPHDGCFNYANLKTWQWKLKKFLTSSKIKKIL